MFLVTHHLPLGLPFALPVLNLFQRLPVEDKAGAITYVAVTSETWQRRERWLFGCLAVGFATVWLHLFFSSEKKGEKSHFGGMCFCPRCLFLSNSKEHDTGFCWVFVVV